ncbi:hypothetical protein [Pseudogemmobacter sonorensis]|uniref:hypothetical protein n=1 Tax=Pseudogemmobacter sonorensis TaxID=2989681 RepID=UPI003691EF65
MIRSLLAALALVAAAPLGVQAQSLSAQDILAQVDKKVATGNEYQALLADPDPARALAAMQIMLASGDAELMRIALNAGLYSPNPTVQRTAVEAFIKAGPVLNIYVDGSAASDPDRFTEIFMRYYNGTVNDRKLGFISMKVGEYNKARSCYQLDINYCLFRISDDGISLFIWDKWNILRVNDQGEIAGLVTVPDVAAPLPIRIPLSN